jgi:hypothetical protein
MCEENPSMRVTVIKNRLRAARRSWAGSEVSPDVAGNGNFVAGVLQGLREALTIVSQSQCEEIKKIKAERCALSRWTGLLLYNACKRAYGRLKEGDRKNAMRILRQVLDRIRI